jgi:hypothetical protein
MGEIRSVSLPSRTRFHSTISLICRGFERFALNRAKSTVRASWQIVSQHIEEHYRLISRDAPATPILSRRPVAVPRFDEA